MIPISQDPSIPVRRTPGAQIMNDFLRVIKIRWKLDFKCNFIVGIISRQNFLLLPCQVQNFITIISPSLKENSMKFPSDFKLRLQNCSWNALQLHRFMPALVFGIGLPQIIAVRKCFVDTMRNYAIGLLISPDVMCKYNLIKRPNNNNIYIYMYIMCGINRNSLFPVTFKPHFAKKNPTKQALSVSCSCPQYALHPCCNFLFRFGLTNASKCERSLFLRTLTLWLTYRARKLPFWPERDVIGRDLISYPTWWRPICELRYLCHAEW